MNSRTNINYMAWKTPIIDLFVYISIQIIRKKFIHLFVFGISECTEILEFECRGKRFFYYISQPRERNDGNKTNLYSAPAASRIISSRDIRQNVASPFFLVEVRCKTAMIIEWAFSGKKVLVSMIHNKSWRDLLSTGDGDVHPSRWSWSQYAITIIYWKEFNSNIYRT